MHSNWKRKAGALLLELLVVFVGVYAAFALNSYREAVRDRERKAVILESMQYMNAALQKEVGAMDSTLALRLGALEDAIEAGERPPLRPIEIGGGYQGGLWEAMLQAGGLDVLSVELILAVESFNTYLRYSQAQLDRLAERNTELLIPNLDRGPDAFYDPETGALRPSYTWVLDGYRGTLQQMTTLRQITTQLDSLLTVEIERLD